ncbi:hypothetical protein IT415_00285 [bacterium]|nr:hypothetical protein [bacterium]
MAPKKPDATKKLQVPETRLTQLQQTNMRNFLIITIAGTVLSVLVGGYFIYQLAQANIKKSNEIKAQDIYIGLVKKKVEILQKSEAQLNRIKTADSTGVSDFSRITERVLPPTDDLGTILTIFQKLQSQTLVQIDDVSKEVNTLAAPTATAGGSSASTSSSATSSFQLSFKSTGTYDQIKNFLKSIEASQRVFDFSTLKISAESNILSLDMTYNLYFKEKPSIADTEMLLSDYQKKHAEGSAQ